MWKFWHIFLVISLAWSQDINLSRQEREQIESDIRQLREWPLANAKKAAESLIRKGEASTPFLLLLLKEGDPRQCEAACYALGQLRVNEAFVSICDAARNPAMKSRLGTLFGALVKIDQERAYPLLLEFVQSSSHTISYPAFRLVLGITRGEHLGVLVPLLKSPQDATRRYAVQLLAQIPGDESLNLMVQALGDLSPKVAEETATILGGMDDPKVREKLLQLASHVDKRLRGYGIIALLAQEDRFKTNLFGGDWYPALLAALRYDDHFVRGTAAAALVNIGFYTDDREIVDLMDKMLAPILIDTISGKVYFKDYVPMRKVAYQKLEQLTGQDFGHRIDAWWHWWDLNKDRFRAVRILKGVSLSDMQQMVLEYQVKGVSGAGDLLLVASIARAEDLRSSGKKVMLVSDSQLVDIADALKSVNFFGLAPQYGSQGNVSHTLNLEIPYHVKKMTVYGYDPGPIKPVVDKIQEIARANRWQRYWNKVRYPDLEMWYREEETWFSGTRDPVLERRRLKQMILAAYGELPLDQRNEAASEFLELMEEDPWLSQGDIEMAMLHVYSEDGMPGRSECLIRATALAKNSLAIHSLSKFLIARYSVKVRGILKFVLEHAEDSLVLQYLKHPNPHLRSVSAEILGDKTARESTVLYLLALVNDESDEVRQATVDSLGNLKAQVAWESIYKIANNRDENFELRHSALLALTKISESRAMPILLECLGRGDPKMRGAIAQCLGEIGDKTADKTAIQTLLALFKDPTPEVRQIAENSLVRIRGEVVVNSLIQTAVHKERLEVRTLAIQALARIGDPGAVPHLVRLLADDQSEIRSEAALALADVRDVRAIPVMIAELDGKKYGFQLRRQLEKLTLVSFPETDYIALKSLYETWWKNHGRLPQKQWLFNALRERNYPVAPLLDYLLGVPNEGIVPLMIQALEDGDWYIRAAACRTLEETTGKTFGAIDPYTGAQTTKEICRAWQKWYRQRVQK